MRVINDNFDRFGRLFLRLGGDRLNALRRRQETQVRQDFVDAGLGVIAWKEYFLTTK